MKIQGLAVIAIIIILPMTILLTAYSKNQIKTLQLQTQYDSKLTNATYDAIKAFQLNMTNSSTSEMADSKMRDIRASINTFYNSLSSHFNMSGYGQDVLQYYVPAVVYTLYDGYYIYSNYTNKLDLTDNFEDEATYKNDESLYGFKPYIYYSCRYVKSGIDVTITYSLDSYIVIQGEINNNPVNEAGYLLTGVDRTGTEGNYKYTYNGVEIIQENDKEGLKQNIYVEGDNSGENNKKIQFTGSDGKPHLAGSIVNYPCKKINGVKYYQDYEGKVFSIINGKKYEQKNASDVNKNQCGIQYYEDAYRFKQKFLSGEDVLHLLLDLKSSDAVDSNGNSYSDEIIKGNYDIFKGLDGTENISIEDENSDFNTHRLQVIRNSIESNLIPAIANFNKVSTSEVNFQMPKLNDEEWEKIMSNVSMITFLQGLNIGGKIYNGHAIVSNNNNEDYVSEDSIYILNNNKYHRVTDSDLSTELDFNNAIGILNTDFQRRSSSAEAEYILTDEDDNEIQDETGNSIKESKNSTVYYYPRENLACYNSIIDANSNTNKTNIKDYLKDAKNDQTSQKYKIAQIYYTALGRERYGLYRVTNKLEVIQEFLRKGFIDESNSGEAGTQTNEGGGNGGGTETEEENNTNTPVSILTAGKYVNYTDSNGNTIPCRVLYGNSSSYGIQIVSVNPVTGVTLGDNDPTIPSSLAGESAGNKAKWSYNNAIITLNNKAKDYLNTSLSPDGEARCVGSDPAYPNNEGGPYSSTTFSYLSTYFSDGSFKDQDTHYTDDETALQAIEAYANTNTTYGDWYWLASRSIGEWSAASYLCCRIVDTNGTLSRAGVCELRSDGSLIPRVNSTPNTRGIRPVFKLKDTLKITGGDGTSSNPYTLGT